MQTLTCPECGRATQRPYDQNMLRVHFDQGAALTKLLRAEFADDIIPGRRCDNDDCGKASDTPKSTRLANSPDILIIQLVRFRDDGSQYDKNTEKVSFGRYLDMSPFIMNKPETKYRLASIVHHSGTREDGRHDGHERAREGGVESGG